jgi:hypothetical protein
MQSASSEAVPARPAGRFAIAGTAILLAAITAGSAATAAFILGLTRLPTVAFLGALTVAGLALSRMRLRWALPLSLLVGIPVSLVAAGWDPWQAPVQSLHELQAMLRMIQLGTAGDTTAPDFLFFLAFWGNAAWLGWFAIRARRPLIAMVPSVAIIVTDVLNVPQDQATYVLGLVVCCCALLLVTAYERSVAGARQHGIWLHDDVRWNFWEMGVAVSVLVLAVTAFAPPVSTVDRTLALQNTLFPGSGPGQSTGDQAGAEAGAGTVIGYSRMVRLLGPLQQSNQTVFTYTSNLSFPGPYYFSGDTATNPTDGAWVPADGSDDTGVLSKNTQLPWEIPVQQQLSTQFQITMKRPQQTAPRTIFYPGQLMQATIPAELQVRYGVAPENVVAVDQAQDADGVPQRYQVTVAGSTATASQLARAGTDYPAWAKRYAQPLGSAYLPRSVLNKIHTLALQAIAVSLLDPYDEATAVQNFLRENYSYTLRPRPVPQGEDAVQAFLDHQTGGYCVYFATVMADMLRSLGIPVILVNGFGPGTFNPATGRFVVRASDAHTWPEVYFPSYGWISFEPTPQTGYGPIPRGGTTIGCPSDICGSGASTGSLGNVSPIAGRGQLSHGAAGRAPHTSHHAGFPWLWPVLGGLAVLLLAALVLFVRWLRPSTLAATWRRTLRLAQLAGVPADPSESPREFSRRLGRAVPALAPAAQALADQVTVAAYAPPGTGPEPSGPVGEGWRTIRVHLLRAAVRRRLPRGRSRAAA